jgi:hypothetical protein
MAQRTLLGCKILWFIGLPGQDELLMNFEVPSSAPNDAVMEDLIFNGTDGGWAGNSRNIAVNTSGNLIPALGLEIANKDNELGVEVYVIKTKTVAPTASLSYTRSEPYTKFVAQETSITLYVEDLIP